MIVSDVRLETICLTLARCCLNRDSSQIYVDDVMSNANEIFCDVAGRRAIDASSSNIHLTLTIKRLYYRLASIHSHTMNDVNES